jgi:hypothetical protein
MHSLVFSGVLNLAQKPLFPRTAKALAVLAAIDTAYSRFMKCRDTAMPCPYYGVRTICDVLHRGEICCISASVLAGLLARKDR